MKAAQTLSDATAFYRDYYSGLGDGRDGQLARWRELSAQRKADHVIELCRRANIKPRKVLEVGCGDGALLQALGSRRLGCELYGCEISATALKRAAERRIEGLAGLWRIEEGDLATTDRFDLVVLSHVLEHAREPIELLSSSARLGGALVVEVPLEENASARRKRAGAAQIGHVNFYDRRSLWSALDAAGIDVLADVLDPLGRREAAFFAEGAGEKARAFLKAAVRRAVFTLSPALLATRLFTVHCAVICRARASGGSEPTP